MIIITDLKGVTVHRAYLSQTHFREPGKPNIHFDEMQTESKLPGDLLTGILFAESTAAVRVPT